jgi:hypothetical protein
MAFPIIMAIKQRAAQKRGKVAAAKEKAGAGGGAPSIPGTVTESADTDSYKRGGKVRKTGLAKVHKGERVLTKAQAKRYKHKRSAKR